MPEQGIQRRPSLGERWPDLVRQSNCRRMVFILFHRFEVTRKPEVARHGKGDSGALVRPVIPGLDFLLGNGMSRLGVAGLPFGNTANPSDTRGPIVRSDFQRDPRMSAEI